MSNPSFNLITEPWIPVEQPGGGLALVSIETTFRNGSELGRIRGANPMVTASLYRLLLAILYRTQCPASLKDWADNWGTGTHWNPALESYLSKWKPRFNLFDREHPFLQSAEPRHQLAPAHKLVAEAATGNNPIFWTHSMDAKPIELPPYDAAQRLVAMQSTGLCGLAGPGRGNFVDGVLVGECVNIVEGASLFDTLHLNLLTKTNIERAIRTSASDAPAWEADRTGNPEAPLGPLDYFTRPTRNIHLSHQADGGVVAEAEMLPGCDFGAATEPILDPMIAYVHDEKKGPRPVRLRTDRAAWRDGLPLLVGSSASDHPPAAIAQLGRALHDGLADFEGVATLRCLASSRRPGKAVLVSWRDETISFDLNLLSESADVEVVADCLADAEDAAALLRSATRRMAATYIQTASGSGDPSALDSLSQGIQQGIRYWAALDADGHELLRSPATVRSRWRGAVARALSGAFDATIAALPDKSAALKAQTAVAGLIHSRIKTLSLPASTNTGGPRLGSTA